MKDTQQNFLFEAHPVRGEIIQLDDTLKTMCQHFNYNAIERRLLGELACIAYMLSALLKVKGRLTVQLQSHAQLEILVVQVDDKQYSRGVLKAKTPLTQSNLLEIAGNGHIVVSLYTETMQEPYQTLVPLTAANLSDNFETYFAQSEQLATKIHLFADEHQVGGVLLQAMPTLKKHDYLDHLDVLLQTLSAEELFSLPFEETLHRLYHEETVRLFSPQNLAFKCACSREKMLEISEHLSEEDLDAIFCEQGHLTLTCEFCNASYQFFADDLGGAYAASRDHDEDVPPEKLH